MKKQFDAGGLPLACLKHCIMSKEDLNAKPVMHKISKNSERTLDNFSRYTEKKVETFAFVP